MGHRAPNAPVTETIIRSIATLPFWSLASLRPKYSRRREARIPQWDVSPRGFSASEKGDKDAVPEIRQILDEHPDLAWQFVDVAQVAEDTLIEKMTTEGDLAAKELIRCQLEAMREQIAGKNCSALERLLSERVVLTWLEVQLFQALYAKNMRKLTIL